MPLVKAKVPVPGTMVSLPRKSALPPDMVKVLDPKDNVPVYPEPKVMDLPIAAASNVTSLTLVASNMRSSEAVGTALLPQLAGVVQL